MTKYKFKTNSTDIEIYFENAPQESVRKKMKDSGFHWNPNKKCWYAKLSEKRLEFTKKIADAVFGVQPNVTIVLPTKNTSNEEVEPPMTRSCCYADSVENFMKIEKEAWKKKMCSAFKQESVLPLGQSQIDAWIDCYDVLKKELVGGLKGFHIVFEYVLPYENGRRPDVLLISNEVVIILEFKRKSVVYVEDLDQVSDYARDIREYHYHSRDKSIVPLLVLTRAKAINYNDKTVQICSSDKLMDSIETVVKKFDSITSCDIDEWIDSKYEPLPTMIEAARRFWEGEDLPNIKQVHAATNLAGAMECLKKVTEDAEKNKKRVLALVTGVPGAGKTFLGLQFVYDVCKANHHQNSVFLSGNAPLVEVLQNALKNKDFVKDVKNVVNEFIKQSDNAVQKNILVFDEGQRAWDKERMTKKYALKSQGRSEPDVLIQYCDQKLDWCVFLVLVGEGQQIHTGENGGIAQWFNAISCSNKDWSVVCPKKLAQTFKKANVQIFDDLDLKVSIRSHTAGEVSNFVNKFIAGELEQATQILGKIPEQDFHMYYTRDLERAKNYCLRKYDHQPKKRYGMIVSSKATELSKLGMPQPVWKDQKKMHPNKLYEPWKVAPWFNNESNDKDSCCALLVAITEFDCQGLEIDMPIIGWGEDAKWIDGRWHFKGEDKEKITYRNNSYRVLLTRGREGFIVFIPKGRDDVAAIFERVGIRELKE